MASVDALTTIDGAISFTAGREKKSKVYVPRFCRIISRMGWSLVLARTPNDARTDR